MSVWIYVWVFSVIPLTDMSILVPIPCCFYSCSSVIQFEIGNGDTLAVLLLFKIILAILNFFCVSVWS